MQKLLNRILPFVLLGIAIAAFAFGIVLLAYLFLFGAFVGIILFGINWLRDKFTPRKKPPSKRTGLTIDSDDWRVL